MSEGGIVKNYSLLRGVSAINISTASFVAGDLVVKFLGNKIPTNELIFIRSLIISLVLGILMLTQLHRSRLRKTASFPVIARCIFDCVNILAFTAAVVRMKIDELYAILLIAPLLMTGIAALFYKERVGWRRWLAVILGFCGILLVVKPNPYALDHWALLGFLAAFSAALRETVTQKIDPDVPTIAVTFYSAVVVGFVILLTGDEGSWAVLNVQQSLLILTLAVGWLVGVLLLVQACRFAPLSIVASFRYMMLVWGALGGYLIFGDIPDNLSVLGACFIVASGLYVFHREAVRHRAIASQTVIIN